MTKLFIKAGLAVLAIALLTSSALAFSPVWEPLPDVIVGGGDGVFTDAIDLTDYVSDEDNDATTLNIVFADGPWNGTIPRSDEETDALATSAVTIDDKVEVAYAGKGDVKLANNSLLSNPAEYITAGDMPITFKAADGVDAAVVLIASDGVTSPQVSKVFRVRGIASGIDELTWTVGVVPIDEWDVTADFTEWAFAGFGTPAPTSGTPADALSITTSLANTADMLAWWQLNSGVATLIPSTAGKLYRSQWTIQNTAAEAAWPAVQMRFFANDSTDISLVNVSANGYVPAAGNARTYENFYLTPAGLEADINLGIYVIDTDNAQGGTVTMNACVVDEITGLDSLFSDVLTIDNGGDFDFTDIFAFNITTDVSWSATADSGVYTVTTQTGTGTFELGQLNTGLTMAANTLYRLRSTVSSTQAVASQPSFQFRMFDALNAKLSSRQLIASGLSTNNAHMASGSGNSYDAYLTSTGIDGSELRFSFDVINNQNFTGTVIWDSAVISSVDLGQIP